MKIEIQNPDLEARLQKQLESIDSDSMEEVLRHLLQTQEEQDRWLQEFGKEIKEKVRIGREQLNRGEGIPDHALPSHLAKPKAEHK